MSATLHAGHFALTGLIMTETQIETASGLAAPHADALKEQLRAILRSGNERFGLEFGIISRISGNDYLVLVQVAPEGTLADGQIFPFADTYCHITCQARDVVAISQMSKSIYRGHPSYEVFKLQTYIGIPILLDGQVIGTLNFSSPIPYPRPFGEDDKAFLRALAKQLDPTAINTL